MRSFESDKLYDAIIIGGGPAGLTAAIYLARARYRVLVIEKETFGGQITITADVVNYPGVTHTDGKELTGQMRRQAQNFGAEFLIAEVLSLDPAGDIKEVTTNHGSYYCFGMILATGAHPRMLGFPGESKFRGRGVAYCATCDGEFFTGKEIFVVGGGFAAAEESVFLTKYARHITILIREDDFTCAKATADAARSHPKITVLTNVEVESVSGDSMLRAIRYRNNKTGEITEYQSEVGETFGVFVFAGYEPATELLKGIAELTPAGYVVTDKNQFTGMEGVFAAGDVCVKNLRQVVTAVGDGAVAATELEKYAAEMQRKTGVVPQLPASGNETEDISPASGSSKSESRSLNIFTHDMLSQLKELFAKMENRLILKLLLDERPVSKELNDYMEELAALTDKLTLEMESDDNSASERPCVRICREDGIYTGLAFHGVPGGHEFTPFILALYNAAGPGQPLDPGEPEAIKAIREPYNMKILVSLTCSMCPELVSAVQQIAASSPLVSAEVYDLNHFPALQEKYQVMSVPCLVINDDQITFGKKSRRQILNLLTS
ncbi:MAG: FAD-dependent oxidoreductase [Clostridiales bacterium]|nr:FAD-dependent oxidoreductase [Clostridiales bacterium]